MQGTKQKKGALRNVDKPSFPAGSKANSLLPPHRLARSERHTVSATRMRNFERFSVDVGGLRM
jgi:hypothetical protein